MPKKISQALENQYRYPGTCIFYDLDNDKCGIYTVRPGICQSFGLHENLPCFRAPSLAVKENYQPIDETVGVLSVDFTWADFK